MKHQQKNNLTPIIAVLAVVAVVLIAVLAILMLRGGEEPAPSESAQLPQVETIPGDTLPAAEEPVESAAEAEVEPVAIETPYITLYYPGEWASVLLVEQSDGEVYTVKFSVDLESGTIVPLFEIRLGGPAEEGFAFFLSKDGEIMAVNAESYPFTPEEGMRDDEIIIVYSMQEAINYVLDGMELFYTVDAAESQTGESSSAAGGNSAAEAVPGDTLPEDNGESMTIDTPYGVLSYPARWQEYLRLETVEEPYSVSFWCQVDGHDDLHLFTVHIGGEEGQLAGTITDADGGSEELRLSVDELALETWEDGDARVARAMQEDLNYLLEALG